MINCRKTLSSNVCTILFFILAFSILVPGLSHGETRTVTNLSDGDPGSLRDILLTVALPGDDIVFAPELAGGTINLTGGQYVISIDLTITGPDDNPITIDAGQNSRIIFVSGAINLVLENLVFQNGFVSGGGFVNGGAIEATLIEGSNIEIHNSMFRNNTAECDNPDFCIARGGAIATFGSLSITGSTFDSNTVRCITSGFCTAFGGAINIFQNGANPIISLSMNNSTICNNQSVCSSGGNCGAFTGGINMDVDGNSSLNNNTFSDNTLNCTAPVCAIAASTLDKQPGGTLNMSNTIIDNSAVTPDDNCNGDITDAGNNLQFPGTSCGGGITVADAMLGPLQINFPGITPTKAITVESPAFNAGNNNTCEATDQRGVERPQFEFCDIGAYELVDNTRDVPTLSEWGLIAMAAILGLVGFMVIRRRQITV